MSETFARPRNPLPPRVDIHTRRRVEAEHSTSFVDDFITSLELDGMAESANTALMLAGRGGVDFNYVIDNDEFKRLTDGIPPELWDRFDSAYSADHASAIRETIQRELKMEEQLAANGWGGFGARMLANTLDPAAAAVSVALGPAAWLNKGTRLTRAMKAGVSAGTANALIEGALASSSPVRGTEDVVYAGLAGLLLGAPLGALGRGEARAMGDAAQAAGRRVDAEELEDLGFGPMSELLRQSEADEALKSTPSPVRTNPLDDIIQTLAKGTEARMEAKRSADFEALEAERLLDRDAQIEDAFRAREAGVEAEQAAQRARDERRAVYDRETQGNSLDYLAASIRGKAEKAREKLLLARNAPDKAPANTAMRDALEAAQATRNAALEEDLGADVGDAVAAALLRDRGRFDKARSRRAEVASKREAARAAAAKLTPSKESDEVVDLVDDFTPEDIETRVADDAEDATEVLDETTAETPEEIEAVWNTHDAALRFLRRWRAVESGKIQGMLPNVEELPEEVQKVIGDFWGDPAGLKEYMDDFVEPPKTFGKDSVGAARVGDAGEYEALVDDSEVMTRYGLDDATAPTSALAGIRFSVVSKLGSSQLPLVRALGLRLFEDGVGYTDRGRTVDFGATERATKVHRTLMTRLRREAEPAYRQWLRANAIPWWKGVTSPSTRARFHESVGDWIRSGGKGEWDENVVAAGKATQKFFKDYLTYLKESGVKGFEDVEFNEWYVPRIFAKDRIRHLTARLESTSGDAPVLRQLIRKGIREALVELDDGMVDTLATAYWTKVRKLSSGFERTLTHGLNLKDTIMVRELLEEGLELSTLTGKARVEMDNKIRAIIHTMKNRGDETSRPARAKHRMQLDENVSIEARDRETGEIVKVSISDLFENNTEKLTTMYSRSMSGWIGLAKEAKIHSPAEWREVIDVIRSQAEELEIPSREVEQDIARLQFGYDHLTGVPLEADPGSVFARGARAARDWNFMRVMNQVGFAQIAEIGNAIGIAGFRNVVGHVPELRGMLTRARNGELKDELARDLEEVLALGTDRLIHTPATRWDEVGFGYAGDGGKGARVLEAASELAERGKRLTADISGMAGVTLATQRLAAKAVLQKLVNHAQGGDLSPAAMRRLRGYGISDEMWKRIQKGLKKHTVTESSVWGGKYKVRRLLSEQFSIDDAEAFDTLTMALHRMARHIIQENDPGNMAMWMSSTLGKTLIQFRTFSINAWERQTLHNVHHRDLTSFLALSWSMAFGGMAYIAQTSINYAGDKKELKERLSTKEVAKAAFQRAGASSLMPSILDTGWTTFAGDDPLFAYGRTTGLASDLLLGNPTVDLVNKISGTLGTAKVLRDDYAYSRKNYRDNVGLAPLLSNALGFRNIHNAVAARLPRESVLDD